MLKCKKCGNILREGDLFCEKCGMKVNKEESGLEKTSDNSEEVLDDQDGYNEGISEERKVFNFQKKYWLALVQYKTSISEIECTQNDLSIRQNLRRLFRKRKDNQAVIEFSEIESVVIKTKMDFWDTLYGVIFAILFLVTFNIGVLFLALLCLFTGFGKIVRLSLKNGLNFNIPVQGTDPDIKEFQSLIKSRI